MASVKEFDELPSVPTGDTNGVEAELMEVLRQERNRKQRKNLLVKRRKRRDKEKSKQKRSATIEDIGIGMMQDTPTGTTAGETYAESIRPNPREIRTDSELSPSRQQPRIVKESPANYDSTGSGFAQWETDWNFADNSASQAPMAGEAAQSDSVSDFSNPDFNPLSFHNSAVEDAGGEGRKSNEKQKRSEKSKSRSKKSKRKSKKREEGHGHRSSRRETKRPSKKSDDNKEPTKEKENNGNDAHVVTGDSVPSTTTENQWESKYRQLEMHYTSLSLHVNIITRQAEQAVESLQEEQKNVRELEAEYYKMQNDLRDARRERDRYEREVQKLKKEVSKLTMHQNSGKEPQAMAKQGTLSTHAKLHSDRDALLEQAIQAHRLAGFPSYEQNGVAVGQGRSRSRPITRKDLEGRERSYAGSSHEGSNRGSVAIRSRSARPMSQKQLDVESSYLGSNHGSSNYGGSNYFADGEEFVSTETESRSSWWGGDAFRKKSSGVGPKKSWTRSLMCELAEERVVFGPSQLPMQGKNLKGGDDATGASSKSTGASEHSKNSDWSSMYQVANRPSNLG